MRFTVASVFALVCLLPAAFAQDAPKTVNGGVLNGKAISLPKPVYPEAARAAGTGGSISVNVLIDESGTVISAEADPYDQRGRFDSDGGKREEVEADISLREAAEAAARLARFAPTRLGGQPVQVKGRIVYNFVDGKATEADFPRPAMGVLKAVDETHRVVSGGVVNGRAIEMPNPVYPPAARAVRAEGTVAVEITIDESGSVTNAVAISGHPLLRAAAEKAARGAKFEPTLLDGKPVMVSGILTYNFVMPKKDDQ
jgi:TonB family protein